MYDTCEFLIPGLQLCMHQGNDNAVRADAICTSHTACTLHCSQHMCKEAVIVSVYGGDKSIVKVRIHTVPTAVWCGQQMSMQMAQVKWRGFSPCIMLG